MGEETPIESLDIAAVGSLNERALFPTHSLEKDVNMSVQSVPQTTTPPCRPLSPHRGGW
jgi:hypothetical protein